MTLSKEDKKHYENAKHQVKRIKMFYLHLILYAIVVALLSYNLYILEEGGPYTNNITALNITVLVLWTALISIHAWSVFKRKSLFNKNWEDRKAKEFLKDKEEEVKTTFWE
ncbi:2TM domain-containing protein [Ichthyenterobacterium magnum]|uniref:2TM domain-containing protein n=1 Tax=Ichthyenterobacterium magnum TaxID=1230530 RepID=A0A420DUT6_9FLAO|nr:2TM domain-containing protein [Ichthyenterobacterium magnum]RKE97939.1 2TM domain-containing protein [Ichthyenterobacterium magnum]